MSILNNLMQDVQAAVESNVVADMNQVQKGGGERKPWPIGTVLARLVGVIELGKRPRSFQGQPKSPEATVMLQFALFGQGYTYDEAGTRPGIINSPDMTLTFTDKSKVKKLFTRMNYTGTKKHFAEMLGDAFLLSITHNPSADGKTIYANIDLDSILPPLDPLTKAPYVCPEAPADYYRLLLWNKPTQQQWDSLLVKKDDGTLLEKQWLQEKVTEALDFNESALYTLLHGALPTLAAAPAPVPQSFPAGTPAAQAPTGALAAPQGDAPWNALAAPQVPAAVPAAPVVPTAVPQVVPQAPAIPVPPVA